MAAPRKSRVLAVHPKLLKDQNQEQNEQAEDERESMFRKISVWFRRKPSPGDLKQIRDIPGKSFQFMNFLLLRKYGLEALTRKIEQYESRVFRFDGGVKEVFLCDWRSGQEFFAEGKVNRELKISTVSFNTAIAEGYMSVSMSNGISHANKKSFLMSLARSAETEFLLPALQELVPQHLKSWNVVPTIKDEIDLENSIFLLVDDIISEVFFGAWLNFDALQIWRSALFKKNNPKAAYQKNALDAFDILYNTVVNCPKAKDILVEGRAYGLNYDEAMKEALYAAVLNSVALSFTITSLVGRLSQVSTNDLKEMKEEVTEYTEKTLSREHLRRLKKIEYFILEVLRMHPPLPVLHGRARFDLLVESSSALYEVKKDERLACSIYQIQRDPHLFSNPSQFLPKRFENKQCKQSLVAFGGNYREAPKAQTHHCCGQEISMTILKVLMIHLLFCKLKLKEQPKWSTNSRSRFGRPNKRLELELFAYREPSYKSSEAMEIIDWDEKMSEVENDNFDVDS